MKTTITLLLILITSLVSSAQSTFQIVSSREDDELLLKWNTLKEVNSSYFLIESSDDGIHFQVAGRVEATGYAMKKTDYEYMPQTKALYFRITLVGMSGEQIGLASIQTEEVKTGLALNK